MKHKLTKIFNKYVGQFLVARFTKARSSRCDLAAVVPECLTNHACKLPITATKITQNIYQPVCKEILISTHYGLNIGPHLVS